MTLLGGNCAAAGFENCKPLAQKVKFGRDLREHRPVLAAFFCEISLLAAEKAGTFRKHRDVSGRKLCGRSRHVLWRGIQ